MNMIPVKGAVFATLARLVNFACVSCGYVESYILDERLLEEIAKSWPRVEPSSSRS
jgi:hypothetical protein